MPSSVDAEDVDRRVNGGAQMRREALLEHGDGARYEEIDCQIDGAGADEHLDRAEGLGDDALGAPWR
jgi:hypothetical protein